MKESIGLVAIGFFLLALVPAIRVYFDGKKLKDEKITKEIKKKWCNWLAYSVVSIGIGVVLGVVSYFL